MWTSISACSGIWVWRKPFCFVTTKHKDLSERLPTFNRALYLQAKQVLEENKAQRHIRGGMATREKYLHQK